MSTANIQKFQTQYLNLINSFEKQVFTDEANQKTISMILDEITCFWLDRKEIASLELEDLSSQKECFLLAGAVYLDVKDNEHYIYKALGDEHFVSDPLLKLEHFFRVPSKMFDNKSIELFRRAYSDLKEMLTSYQSYFYILPIQIIAISNQEEHRELLQKFYLTFINSVLNENFEDADGFFEKYSTYDEIEKNIVPFFKKNLILEEHSSEELTLKDKIETYINSHNIMVAITKNYSEAEKFWAALQNYVTQIMDILLIASITNTIPFIRFKPIFHYLTIVMYTFIQDIFFKDILEKTIVFYIFYNTVEKEELTKINFNEFVKMVQETNFLNNILQEMKKNNIDIFQKGVPEVANIINEHFCMKIKDTTKPSTEQ
ncbi:MAG: hypothetical protein RBR23_07045 [Arcobacteraceae bacterium]|nr:hypothetical protein [Arcobacteraceae bacterium]